MNSMKKILLSMGVIVGFIAYSLYHRHQDSSAVVAPAGPSASGSSASSMPDKTISSSASSGLQTSSKYKDGTYTGSVADAFYGNIQVQAIIKSGKITDVIFLQYPNDQQNSTAINNQAMPYLKKEALQIQDSNVNVVSGATDTSQAFVQSLAAALDQAQKA